MVAISIQVLMLAVTATLKFKTWASIQSSPNVAMLGALGNAGVMQMLTIITSRIELTSWEIQPTIAVCMP